MAKAKRILKRLVIGIGLLVAIVLLINGVLAWYTQNRWNQKISNLREAGFPASLTDLKPKAIPPEENAAVVLKEMIPRIDDFGAAHGDFYSTPLGKSWDEAEGEAPSDQVVEAMKSILNRYPDILAAIEKAANCPNYASQYDYDLPPCEFLQVVLNQQSSVRSLAHYASWQMKLQMAEGKYNEAVQLGIQMLKVSRHLNQEPLLVNYLVNIAVRGVILADLNLAVRSDEILPATRAELDAELAKLDSRDGLLHALVTDRAFAIPFVAEQLAPIPALVRWPAWQVQLGMMAPFDQACDAAKLPWSEIRSTWDAGTNRIKPNGVLAGFDQNLLIGPAILAVFDAESRIIVLVRCLRILNALQTLPVQVESKAELLKELPLAKSSMLDPYSDAILKLKRTNEGWVVYSVWLNQKDDNGRFNYMDGDWGLGPLGYPYEN